MTLGITPSQTVGPFFAIGLPWSDGPHVVPEGTPGAIWVRGAVLDGGGDPIPDALVESWQADPAGRFNHPDDPRGAVSGFRGFGRSATDSEGRWSLLTLKPGRVPDRDGRLQAPHIDLSVFSRGLLDRCVTRVYFADEAAANAEDPLLQTVAPERRSTIIAAAREDGYHLDIHLQGPEETVFFAL
jgi:protocatechuate 3,4-dioxygenase, alpha subunit